MLNHTAPQTSTPPAETRERLVAPRITLSQARTLAAFESLHGYLSEVQREGIGPVLRVTFPADDIERTGIVYVDVTIDGAAYIRLTAGGWNFIPRETMREELREALA
jgi:hypothetical protein